MTLGDRVAFVLLWISASGLVLCAVATITEWLERRRSSFPRSSEATRRVGGPVASPLSARFDIQTERERAARDRAINQVLRDAGYPIDEELGHRGSRS